MVCSVAPRPTWRCAVAWAAVLVICRKEAPRLRFVPFRSCCQRLHCTRTTARGLNRGSSAAPPLELFEGLDELEEEEEEEEEAGAGDLQEPDAGAGALVPRVDRYALPGSGILELQRLEAEYRKTDVEPELAAEDLRDLHVALAREAHDCPSAATVAWMAHTLEDLMIEEDDVLAELAEILIKRADELSAQSVVDVVCSYGNVYWPDCDELLDAFAGAIRRQLEDFTVPEIARLGNALIRLGAIDDPKYVGLFFDMRQRAHLPYIDEYVRRTLNSESQINKEPSEATLLAMRAFENMPNKRLKAKAEKMLQHDLEEALPRLLDEAKAEEVLRREWATITGDEMAALTGGGGDETE